jgi:hypothetical protein
MTLSDDLSEELKEKLEIIQRKRWWPVASLAEVLGKPKLYVYRHIDKGHFVKYKDGGPTKILSESVVKFFNDT